MKKETTEKILAELETGYDLIADKFSSTRAFMWRDLEFIRDVVKPEDRVLDFGCGNGRLTGFLENKFSTYTGVDISQKLIDIAKQTYHSEKNHFIKIDSQVVRLPFKDNYFDEIFSIAVFHHFPSKEYAGSVAKELQRILKPGGKIVITVWNLWQKQYLQYHQKTHKGWPGADIPFKAEEKIFSRYHHPFKMGELSDLLQETGFSKLKTKEGMNLLYIGEKSVGDKSVLTKEKK